MILGLADWLYSQFFPGFHWLLEADLFPPPGRSPLSVTPGSNAWTVSYPVHSPAPLPSQGFIFRKPPKFGAVLVLPSPSHTAGDICEIPENKLALLPPPPTPVAPVPGHGLLRGWRPADASQQV